MNEKHTKQLFSNLLTTMRTLVRSMSEKQLEDLFMTMKAEDIQLLEYINANRQTTIDKVTDMSLNLNNNDIVIKQFNEHEAAIQSAINEIHMAVDLEESRAIKEIEKTISFESQEDNTAYYALTNAIRKKYDKKRELLANEYLKAQAI